MFGNRQNTRLFYTEREGFEPSVQFPVRRFSKPFPSATRASLHAYRALAANSSMILKPAAIPDCRIL